MAIRTVHGIVNGMLARQDLLKTTGAMEAAGVMHSLLYAAGRPGAGVAPSPGIAGAALTSYAGQIPHVDAPVLQQTYLALFEAWSSAPGTLLVCDRLWHNSGIAVATTTAQNVNSVALRLEIAWERRTATAFSSGSRSRPRPRTPARLPIQLSAIRTQQGRPAARGRSRASRRRPSRGPSSRSTSRPGT